MARCVIYLYSCPLSSQEDEQAIEQFPSVFSTIRRLTQSFDRKAKSHDKTTKRSMLGVEIAILSDAGRMEELV